jgi:hypothetical protein
MSFVILRFEFVFPRVLFRTMLPRIEVGFVSAIIICSGILSASELPPIRLSPESTFAACERGTIRNVNMETVTEPWNWQLLPDGFIYPTYLAGVQNRLGGVWNYDPDIDWNWDITLGGRTPLLRYGNKSALFPEGWQLDMEGSTHLRLHLRKCMDMEANDFRFGIPLSYGTKIWQVRTGYYHVSSHIGDERMLRHEPEDHIYPGDKHPPGNRLNYYREAWLLSYAFRPTATTRLYAEADYAFMRGEWTKLWHFQFGAEYSPRYPARGGWGTPFAAVNVRLMQEYDFDGNITVQTGWQWRGMRNQLFRLGVQYFGGVSDQYEFIAGRREHKIGIGVWYDF